jgi:hypothetical protein
MRRRATQRLERRGGGTGRRRIAGAQPAAGGGAAGRIGPPVDTGPTAVPIWPVITHRPARHGPREALCARQVPALHGVHTGACTVAKNPRRLGGRRRRPALVRSTSARRRWPQLKVLLAHPRAPTPQATPGGGGRADYVPAAEQARRIRATPALITRLFHFTSTYPDPIRQCEHCNGACERIRALPLTLLEEPKAAVISHSTFIAFYSSLARAQPPGLDTSQPAVD